MRFHPIKSGLNSHRCAGQSDREGGTDRSLESQERAKELTKPLGTPESPARENVYCCPSWEANQYGPLALPSFTSTVPARVLALPIAIQPYNRIVYGNSPANVVI